MLRAQADVLVGIVRDVSERVEDIEDQLLARRLDQRRIRLGRLRRLLVRLQRLLAPERQRFFVCFSIRHRGSPRPTCRSCVSRVRNFRSCCATWQRCRRIKLLQEEISAEVNEGNNRSLFVLTAVTVFALPINLIAGLLGMNVGGIPLAEHSHGFAIVVTVILTITGIVALFVLRRHRDR